MSVKPVPDEVQNLVITRYLVHGEPVKCRPESYEKQGGVLRVFLECEDYGRAELKYLHEMCPAYRRFLNWLKTREVEEGKKVDENEIKYLEWVIETLCR